MAGEASDVVKYYRVRKSWDDAKSQLSAYTILANAKAMAGKHPGYEVYDWNGKQVYPEVAEGDAGRMSNADCPFMVKVSIPDLNIRKGAGTNYFLPEGKREAYLEEVVEINKGTI